MPLELDKNASTSYFTVGDTDLSHTNVNKKKIDKKNDTRTPENG